MECVNRAILRVRRDVCGKTTVNAAFMEISQQTHQLLPRVHGVDALQILSQRFESELFEAIGIHCRTIEISDFLRRRIGSWRAVAGRIKNAMEQLPISL